MKKFLFLTSIIISLLIINSCNPKEETASNKIVPIPKSPVVETKQTDPQQSWKESLLSGKAIETEKDIESIKLIIEKAVENNRLDELQTFLETESKKEKVPPQILFGLSLVYGRKGLVKEEYKAIEKLEEQVKQRPGIVFNLSLVYGRKETLKSQINKAEAEAKALLQGYISVKSTPAGAEVYLDGELKGKTPFTTEGLGEGSYAVELQLKDYTDLSKTISVKAGKTTEVTEELVLLPGRLVINSEPTGATVLLNGEERGVTPLKLENIIPGTHEILLAKTDYEDKTVTITIEPDKTETINTDLITLTGNIFINSLTEGAIIILDGERVFPQTGWIKKIPTGHHSLLIKKNEYVEKNYSVTIISGETNYLLGKLEKVVIEIPFAKIKVDGKASDWKGIEPTYQYNLGPDPFPNDSGTDFKNFKVAYDNNNLYYILEFNDPPCSTKKDYYYQINIYQTALNNQRDNSLNDGDIRVNHNLRSQPGGTFIWDSGKFEGTRDTFVKGSTYLEGSIPRNRITFDTNLFYIACVLNKKPGNVWQAEFIKISIP